jgi:integrase
MIEDREELGKAPFTANDLRRMFPSTYLVEGLNWLPLVMLYHGMRPTEAAQLDTADVIQVDGVWAFDISEETKGALGRARWGDKSLKNDRPTPRRIPIHQKILDRGFLDYLRSRVEAAERKLFAVKCYGEAGYFESIRHEFTQWLEAVGVKRSNTSPHSMRHTWMTAAFPVVDDPLRKIMGGWTLGKGVDVSVYLHTHHLSMADMKAALDKVAFDILTADEDPANAHPGLIAVQRARRGGAEAAGGKRPKKGCLVPGKLRT